MSLDYELRLETNFNSNNIYDILSNQFDLQPGEDQRLFNSGIIIGVSPEKPATQYLMLENYGFKPTIDVWFRLKHQDEKILGKQTLLNVSILLLSQISGDAVLLFNSEKTVLQRISGVLIFNQKPETWQDSELSQVELNYHVKPLKSPLLGDPSPKIAIQPAIYSRLQALAISQGKSLKQLTNDVLKAGLINE
ncbi:hypothetical protein PCC9214_02198 [Planktothrix tepida]|uniref:Uncharacterized protein n=2 Tax=Planktothrix TaxID=54304 RepID=A0A1J1LJY0_9CYAN|nr:MULTISPECIES: SitI3 family protein [Planktothrix]MBD2481499.1 hypothetical protein [Planktothrix sp. FACHB-1365]CAD5945290.1 hypothetical protein PCC9214_02198 [Planktothrix tepida]CAD5965711.1 hypothetical protein NO713_03488 [Planktothrix pseudagardhii]CUR32840.1 hypothetical protein PL9214500087 [Planktothrix tepida PCC 9214]